MAWLAQSHLILMNTQRKRMKHKKCFVFNIITNQSVQKGASVLFMLIQWIFFSPTMLNSAATSHVIVSLCLLDVSIDLRCGVTGILLWPQADTCWIGCHQPAAENLAGWSAARGKWKKKQHSLQDHMITCTFNYAHSSRVFFFSICVHQAQKKNNMGLPAG